MKPSKDKSAAQTRRAARGNLPGFLGLKELAALAGYKADQLKPGPLPKERKR